MIQKYIDYDKYLHNVRCYTLCGLKERIMKVFAKGLGSADHYRIPSVVRTKSGTLIAAADERYFDGSDCPNRIDKVIRRSADGGASWSPVEVIVRERGEAQLSSSAAIDPALLYDEETDTVFMLYLHTPPGVGLANSGRGKGGTASDGTEYGTSYLMLTESRDEGKTWKAPVCLNGQVKDDSFAFIGAGPGIGIAVREGRYKGRLVYPIYYGMSDRQPSLMAAAIYSDDHGKTWKRGKPLRATPPSQLCDGVFAEDSLQVTETQIAEAGGALIAIARNHDPVRRAARAVSADGGESWAEYGYVPEIRQPICQMSVLAFRYGGEEVLAIVHPDDERARVRGTVHLSFDGGKTFPVAQVFVEGDFLYSSLCFLPESGELLVLYESDWSTIEQSKIEVKPLYELYRKGNADRKLSGE